MFSEKLTFSECTKWMIVYIAMKVHLTKNKIKAPLAILLTHK